MKFKNRMIVDASVGCKWFFEENFQEKARQLLKGMWQRQVMLSVPEFFYLEFSNICWKRVKKNLLPPDEALRVLKGALNLPLERYPDRDLAGAALENACLFGITVYDGLYVALAKFYSAPLVTADDKLIEACRRRNFEFVEPLSSLDFPGL